MPLRGRTKATLMVALVAAAFTGGWSSPEWVTPAALAFGIANVLILPPGAEWVGLTAIGAAAVTLLWPGAFWVPMVYLVGLAWPLALALAWLVRRDHTLDQAPADPPPRAATPARVAVAAIIGAVAVATALYEWLIAHHLGQSAALFIGVPTLLAIAVVFLVSPRSATGVACKAVTIGLLVSLLFLGEGVLCVVLSAPLFLGIAILIGSAIEMFRSPSSGRPGRTLACVWLLALAPMSLEGVTGTTSLDRDEQVTVTRTVSAPAAAVEHALFAPPRFERTEPLALRAGFPRPIASAIDRRGPLARWTIRLRGGEMRLDGVEPRTGDLVLELAESRPGLVQWRAVQDDSHVTHYLAWRESTVTWEPVTASTTRVTWTLRYRRSLDPAWYFGPLQRYAAGLAAGYLIETVATP